MTLTECLDLLAARLSVIDGLTVTTDPAAEVIVPMAIIDAPEVDYNYTMAGGATVNFTVTVYVSIADTPSGLIEARDYLSPSGASSVSAAISTPETADDIETRAHVDTGTRSDDRGYITAEFAGTARIEGGVGIATLQLSRREDVAGIVQDIADGIIRNISVGYMVHEYQVTERQGELPLMRAVDWEPAEISFVPIPADAAATVRSVDTAQGGHPCIIRHV